MEISSLPSSALRFSDVRSRQIIDSLRHTVNHLATSKSFHIRSSRIEFYRGGSYLEHSTKGGTHWLKIVPIQAQAQQGEAVSSFEGAAKSELPKKSDVIWRFLRPFPVIFTLIQFSSILARLVMVENPHVLQSSNWSMFFKLLAVFTSISCTNIYATGVNQIFDIETDKINKPHLPLCSEELPIESAWLLVMSFVAISLLMAGTLNSLPFLAFNFCLLLVASSYSIPPFRTKASTLGAPITLSMLNGSVQFLATLAGAQAALGLPFRMSLPSVFISIFSSIFALGMGIVKDIPDVEGDEKSNIPTVATIIGVRRTLLIGLGILISNHFGAALLTFIRPESFKSSVMIPFHILSIFFLLFQAGKVDKANYEVTESMKTYLTFLGVFLVQVLLFPFI